MMKEGHGPTKYLQDLNWGAFDHASHAPQLRSCKYYLLDVTYIGLQYRAIKYNLYLVDISVHSNRVINKFSVRQ